ncbi:hypothetical protein Tco_0178105 [Tanacetum coccineum]
MTENPDIPKRLHENYYRVTNDEIVKLIFKSWKNKEDKIMWIPDWMLTKEMKLIRHYQLYVFVFGVDVPMTQSQPTESTQGTHRTLSTPRTSNPVTTQDESSAPCKPTVISTRALMDEEIEQIIEGDDNVNEDEFMDEIFNSQEHLGTRLELESHKERPKVEKSDDVLIINNDWEEEESAGDALIWRNREKGKGMEEIRDTPPPNPLDPLGLDCSFILG